MAGAQHDAPPWFYLPRLLNVCERARLERAIAMHGHCPARLSPEERRATGIAWAQQLSVNINKISESGVGENVGTVTIAEGNSESFGGSEVEHSGL